MYFYFLFPFIFLFIVFFLQNKRCGRPTMNEKLTMTGMVKNEADSSDLLVVKICSVVSLRIYVFLCASGEQYILSKVKTTV